MERPVRGAIRAGKSVGGVLVANLWIPQSNADRRGELDKFRRPYCACCGLPPSNPKFGGKVVIANQAGNSGKREIIFCGSCAVKEEAQVVYKEIMFQFENYIIKPSGYC